MGDEAGATSDAFLSGINGLLGDFGQPSPPPDDDSHIFTGRYHQPPPPHAPVFAVSAGSPTLTEARRLRNGP